MPIVDVVIRETIRLVKSGPSIRLNVADNVRFANKTIDKGAFVIYSMGEIHLDENIYSKPLEFDPGRFLAPREEDKQGNLLFLGWGAGRHICSGQQFDSAVDPLIMSLQG